MACDAFADTLWCMDGAWKAAVCTKRLSCWGSHFRWGHAPGKQCHRREVYNAVACRSFAASQTITLDQGVSLLADESAGCCPRVWSSQL